MNVKEAYALARFFIKGRTASKCVEFDNGFVFDMVPLGYDIDKGPVLDSSIYVDKKTGEVGAFDPMTMPLSEFKSGKEIPVPK